MSDATVPKISRHVTLWWRDGEASKRLHDELVTAGYDVERRWSGETEPVVSNGIYFSRGYDSIYERFLSPPLAARG